MLNKIKWSQENIDRLPTGTEKLIQAKKSKKRNNVTKLWFCQCTILNKILIKSTQST